MSAADKGREEAIEKHQLPTASDQLLVHSELAVGGHGELQEVGVVTALAEHHPHIGQLNVSG